MNPEITQGSLFFLLHMPQQFRNSQNHHILCKKGKRPYVAGFISCHGAGVSILASPTCHSHGRNRGTVRKLILSHMTSETVQTCFSLTQIENQDSDVDISIWAHEPYTLSLSPGSPRTLYFPPPLCSPFTHFFSLQGNTAGNTTNKHCSTKNTNEHVTPHSLQLLGDIFFQLPWITHSRDTLGLLSSCTQSALLFVGGLWLLLVYYVQLYIGWLTVSKQKIKWPVVHQSLLDSLQCFASARIQCY